MIAQALRDMFLPAAISRPRDGGYPYSLENPNFNLDLRDPSNWDLLFNDAGATSALSGVRVTHEDLLTFAPITRALKILGGDAACSPLHVCKTEVDPGDDVIDEDHPIDAILSEQWNATTAAAAGWEQYIQEANLFGSAFAWIERGTERRYALEELNWNTPIGLYHLNPLLTVPRQAKTPGYLGNEDDGFLYVRSGDKYYETTVGGKTIYLAWNEVLEYTPLRVMPRLNMLKVMSNVVGLALAAQGFQSKFFANGAQAGGFISVPPESTPASTLNLQNQLKKRQSADTWFKLHILRDGAKFQQLTIDPKSSDMHSIDERAARRVSDYYDIQPQLMGIPGSDSYGAGESARTDHITRCMNHVFVQVQGECKIKMFSPAERRRRKKRRRTLRHFYDKLIEPDYKTMVDTEIRLHDAEIVNANDVLFRLGRKTRTDKKALEYQNSNTSSNNKNNDSEDDSQSADQSVDIEVTSSEQLRRIAAQPEQKSKENPDGLESARAPQGAANGSEKRVGEAKDTRDRRFNAVRPRITKVIDRLTVAVNNKAKDPETFRQLMESGLGEYRVIFREEVEPVTAIWLDDQQEAMLVAEVRFFDQLMDHLLSAMADAPQDSQSATQATKARQAAVRTATDNFKTNVAPAIAETLVAAG